MQDVRLALESHAYECEQPSGVKFFVHPCQFWAALQAISDKPLSIGHIVVSESLGSLVEAALSTIPSRRRRKPREAALAEVDSAYVLDAQRTFLCWVPRDVGASAVAQSTTRAHGGRNPRQATNHAV